MKSYRYWMITVVLAMLTSSLALADTTFTYQGELNESGTPANGMFNIDFALWDSLAGGNQIGSTFMLNSVPVSEGIFTVELDFGTNAFDNSARWLEIAVNGTELEPRQPITRTPYSIQTRGIVVDENNNVGIGTSTPNYPLHVETDDGFAAIGGSNTATSGYHYGGRFVNDSTSGSGVLGEATAFDGINYGVYGRNSSREGVGVFGEAQASTGITLGGQFVSHSPSGRGVYGWATATGGGTNYGGYFQSDSTAGRGVYGWASSGSGFTYGGQFQSDSTSGRGVYGVATANSGNTYGGGFESHSTSGRGVYGVATANSGQNYGVFGGSNSSAGTGVYGYVGAFSGITYGGWFESASTVGRGINGFATSTSGVNYAVVGHSNSSSGYDFWASGAGTDYGSNSSRRWKSNIVPIGDPLTKLAQIRGVYFDWDAEHGGAHAVGMIAEEVGAVMPEIVQYEENGIDAIGMDYSKMTPLLVEAVNALRSESNQRLAEKDDEISELRQQLSDLQQIVEQLASNQEKEIAP